MMRQLKRNRFAQSNPRTRPVVKVERRVVTVSYPRGPRDVDAHVLGPLAVHRDCDVDASLGVNWIVTHVRTGGTVIGAHARATFKQAMKIARDHRVQEVDWDFGKFGVKPSSFVLSKARQAVRAAGIDAGLRLRGDL